MLKTEEAIALIAKIFTLIVMATALTVMPIINVAYTAKKALTANFIISRITGEKDVAILRSGTPFWIAAKESMALYAGDAIRTGANIEPYSSISIESIKNTFIH